MGGGHKRGRGVGKGELGAGNSRKEERAEEEEREQRKEKKRGKERGDKEEEGEKELKGTMTVNFMVIITGDKNLWARAF